MNAGFSDPAVEYIPRRAFTLIELLVVVSIIGLLVSILLPALSGARKSGRALKCETHLRTLGRAMRMYADAYDDVVPLSEAAGLNNGSLQFAAALLPTLGQMSMNAMRPYGNLNNEEEFLEILGKEQAFQCPDFPEDDQRLDYVVNAFNDPYTRNDDPGPPGGGPQTENAGPAELRQWAKLTRLSKSSASVIYLTEGHERLPTDSVSLHDVFFSSQLPRASRPRIASDLRHPGGINALFFDTHVEPMRQEQMDVGDPQPLASRMRWFSTVVTP